MGILRGDVGASVLPYDLLYQAHKASTINILRDTTALTDLEDTEAQRQISAARKPQFWRYIGNVRLRHSLKREENMKAGKKNSLKMI